jgi:hypothetical protein
MFAEKVKSAEPSSSQLTSTTKALGFWGVFEY